MERIFVPSDFSVFAQHAFDMALNWARKFDASIILYHCLDIPPRYAASQNTEELEKEYEQLQKNAETLIAQLKKTANELGVQFTSKIDRGKFINCAKAELKENPADLIIMGSHGASGKNEYLIGSNTQKMVRSIHIPSLIVKEEVKSVDFERVIYASYFSEKDKPAFQQFLDIISPFAPKLYLLAINTTSFFSQPSLLVYEAMDDFIDMAKPLDSQKHFYNDISIEAGIRHFSESWECKLIGISNHYRHPIKRLIQGSNVEMLINHSRMPVLTIDY